MTSDPSTVFEGACVVESFGVNQRKAAISKFLLRETRHIHVLILPKSLQ